VVSSALDTRKTTMNDMGMAIVICAEQPVAIWLHTTQDPPMTEWSAAMKHVVEVKQALGGDVSNFKTLAISDGGAPNTVQRGELFAQILEGKSKAAVVTNVLSNRLKRGIATAIFWLNPNFRAYSPDQFDQALAHLDLTPHRAQLMVAVNELQKRVTPLETVKQINSQ
jgi:hypothetical protein